MNDTADLFPGAGVFEQLAMVDADVKFMSAFYPPSRTTQYADILLRDTPWRHEKIVVYGKEHLQPRLTCWYGDADARYTYSGLTLIPQMWTPTLQQIREDLEAASGHRFNSVLLNLYRNECDSMGWHSDDETELGHAPVIGSLSLGATRILKFKHKVRRDLKPFSIALSDGSLLLMAGATQHNWLHGIDKTRTVVGPRINLTFRRIISSP